MFLVSTRVAIPNHPRSKDAIMQSTAARFSFAAALAIMLSCPTAGFGQTLRGRLVDDATGEPVANAAIVVLDEKDAVRARVLTEPDGSFLIVLNQLEKLKLR